jgi:hypothetical protein
LIVLPGAALALLMAARREPEPAVLLSVVLITVNVPGGGFAGTNRISNSSSCGWKRGRRWFSTRAQRIGRRKAWPEIFRSHAPKLKLNMDRISWAKGALARASCC